MNEGRNNARKFCRPAELVVGWLSFWKAVGQAHSAV